MLPLDTRVCGNSKTFIHQHKESTEALTWTETKQTFEAWKTALTLTPNVSKHFHLFVHKTKDITKWFLTQSLGPWKCPVIYLSRWLDSVATGWPTCLKDVTTTARQMKKEASKQRNRNKLGLGQDCIFIATPDMVEALILGAPEHWLSNDWVTQYKATLLAHPQVWL